MEFFAHVFDAYVALGAAGMLVVGAALSATLFFAFFEKGWPALLGLAGLTFGTAFFGGVHPWLVIADHPILSALGFVGYFVAGSFWSVAKFRFYTGNLKNKFRDFKMDRLGKAGAKTLEELDPAQLASFRQEAEIHMSRSARYGEYPVKPQQHKAVILFWMGWWPVSMIAYALDEPIKKLMESLYRMFSGVYAKIAKEQGREYMSDMGK